MKLEDNLSHWDSWARNFGTELRATTKCKTIKRLEIDALGRMLSASATTSPSKILEIGCGNGINGFALTTIVEGIHYIGIDFSANMVENAILAKEDLIAKGKNESARMAFAVCDARYLSVPFDIDSNKPHFIGSEVRRILPIREFDAVFTDRMLINLASAEEQLEVMHNIHRML